MKKIDKNESALTGWFKAITESSNAKQDEWEKFVQDMGQPVETYSPEIGTDFGLWESEKGVVVIRIGKNGPIRGAETYYDKKFIEKLNKVVSKMRCWECDACNVVKGTKQITLAKIASWDITTSWGIKDSTMRNWNQCLEDNPCENLEKENDKLEHE